MAKEKKTATAIFGRSGRAADVDPRGIAGHWHGVHPRGSDAGLQHRLGGHVLQDVRHGPVPLDQGRLDGCVRRDDRYDSGAQLRAHGGRRFRRALRSWPRHGLSIEGRGEWRSGRLHDSRRGALAHRGREVGCPDRETQPQRNCQRSGRSLHRAIWSAARRTPPHPARARQAAEVVAREGRRAARHRSGNGGSFTPHAYRRRSGSRCICCSTRCGRRWPTGGAVR